MVELVLVGALCFIVGDAVGFTLAWVVRNRREAKIVTEFAKDVKSITDAAEAEIFVRSNDV